MSQAGQFFQNSLLATLTGDSGGAITPVAGNIDILGGAGINVAGTAGTLTISHAGAFADSFVTDAGTAIPVAGDTNILGGANINTTGAGNTVTVILDDSVTLVGSLTAGTTINATVGDITADAGDIVSTLGDLVSDAGNISATVGSVDAGATITAGTGIDTTTGNITADAGNIVATLGSVSAATTVTAGTGISSTTGNITAVAANVIAEGDLIANTGSITAVLGSLDAATSLTVGTTVTFTTITDGGLVADASGVVTVSGALSIATGFDQWSAGGPFFDDTVLGSFTVEVSGSGYINGLVVSWAGGQTATGLTAGNTYLIFMDDTGTIGSTTTLNADAYQNNIPLFEVLRDSTGTNVQYTVKENHPFDFQVAISAYNHAIIGTVISNASQGANITLNGTQKVEIVGADELMDHGLVTTIPDGGSVAETWNQMYTNGAGKWATYQSSDTFNGFWNSAGTATAPSGTKFSVYTLYVSKDNITADTPTYWAVLDDQEYNSLIGAQTAIAAETMAISTNELQKLELAQLGHIIYRQSTSAIVDVVIEKSTLRSTTSGGSGTDQASLITTNVTNFDGILSASDTTVQVALDTIDEWGKTTTDHAVLIGNGTGSPIGSLAVGTNGQVIVGSTGADPVFANITSTGASVTITEGAGTINLESDGVDQSNILYVGKHGNDADDGLTVDKAFLTFGAAQAAASPGYTLWCFDNGTYTENLTGSLGIGIHAPNAVLVGAHTMTTGNGWNFSQMNVATGTTGITMATASQNAFLNVGRMEIAGNGIGITCTAGILFVIAGSVVVENGFFVGSSTADEVQLLFGEVVFTGTGVGFGVATSGKIQVTGDSVKNIGAGDGTVFNSIGGGTPQINAVIACIDSDILSDITATSIISVTAACMTGTLAETGAGTIKSGGTSRIDEVPIGAVTPSTGAFTTLSATTPVVVASGGTGVGTLTDHGVLVGSGTGAITPLAVGTSGQVIVGATGADPVFATISSTDSSITITEGPGTLALTGTQSTTSQLGSVELATDAESINGTDTVRPIVPSSLAAKLGTQTNHGVLVGASTAAALTALAVGTNGQVLVGSTGADPVFATVASADASIDFSLGAGTIDLSVSGLLSINAQTGTSYELVAGDAGKLVTCDNAAAIALTVPVNADVAMAVGTTILIAQKGAGIVTLTPEGGVTLSSRGALLDTAGQYAMVTITKISTDVWFCAGDTA